MDKTKQKNVDFIFMVVKINLHFQDIHALRESQITGRELDIFLSVRLSDRRLR